MMMIISILIVINILVAFARIQKRKWLRVSLFVVAAVLLLPAFLVGIRMMLQG